MYIFNFFISFNIFVLFIYILKLLIIIFIIIFNCIPNLYKQLEVIKTSHIERIKLQNKRQTHWQKSKYFILIPTYMYGTLSLLRETLKLYY